MTYRERQNALMNVDRKAWNASIAKVLPPGGYEFRLEVGPGIVTVYAIDKQTSCEAAGTADRPLAALSDAIYALRDEIDNAKAGIGNDPL